MTCPRPPRTAVFLVLLASCATAPKNEAPVVHDLTIEGTHHLSAGTIEDLILTTDTGWWPFATKHRFAFPLLSDPDKAVAREYGTLGPIGFPRRSVFIIDADGIVRYAHRAIAGLTFRPVAELIDAVRAAKAD